MTLKIKTLEGTWSLTGDQSSMTVDPKNHPRNGHESKTNSISITGNKMVVTDHTGADAMFSKMETSYQKI